MNRPLTLGDVLDLRAYEREREAFRAEVIALKKLRRVAIGPLASAVFENSTTVRFQVQEMVRAEMILEDRRVQDELDAYNPLVPGRGELSLTLFLELRSEQDLRTWLPRLVGIERSLLVRFGAGTGLERRGEVEAAHSSMLTREETTSSVHYVKITLGEEEIGTFVEGPAVLACDHPEYPHAVELESDLRLSLAGDWS
ncbi:MAG TPA: DUF3501 family protein [Acidimicrobiales bacterium]|nr:DUF3501 family protein [Acidimicrobiales bacterium]